MDLNTYILFLFSGWVIAATPGASTLFALSQSLQFGVKEAKKPIMGLIIGNILYAFLPIFGVDGLLEKIPGSFFIFKILGALYLFLLAGQHLFKNYTVYKSTLNVNSNSMWSGLMVALSNPSFMIFYFIFVPQFINPSQPVMHQLFILSFTQLAIDAVCVILYAFLANQLRALLENTNNTKIMDKLVGIILIISAILLIMSTSHNYESRKQSDQMTLTWSNL